jgi:hypothetical protein
MSMPVRAVSNERDERRSNDLIRALSDFTKQHRAAHWAGTFASFLESVFPADARVSSSPMQWIWLPSTLSSLERKRLRGRSKQAQTSR